MSINMILGDCISIILQCQLVSLLYIVIVVVYIYT